MLRHTNVAVVVIGLIVAAYVSLVLSDASYEVYEVPSAPPKTEVPITFDPGFATDPALSSDGKYVVYASDSARLGKMDIWIQEIDLSGQQVEPKRLTNDSSDNTEPFFSPDGKHIVFHSTRDGGGLYVLPIEGGEAEPIVKDGHHPVFSPDGRYIAYEARSRGERITIRLKELATGESRELLPSFYTMFNPRWSPDSKQIAFVGADTFDTARMHKLDVWVTPIEDGSAVPTGVHEYLSKRAGWLFRRTFDTLYSAYVPVAWLADGIFVAGSDSVWAVEPPSQNSVEQVAPRLVITDSPRHVGSTEWSALDTVDGHSFVVSSYGWIDRLWGIPIAADNGEVSGDMQVVTAGPHDGFPRISADGKVLLFLSQRMNRTASPQLYARDMNTQLEVMLTAPPMRPNQYALSADGRAFAFVDTDTGEPNVFRGSGIGYWSALSERKLMRFCEDCSDISDISTAPTTIWFGALGRLQVLDYSTGRVSLAIPESLQKPVWQPVFSADQNWIAFMSGSKQTGIYAARYSGNGRIPAGNWIPIVDGSYNSRAVQWSPRGDVIYFISRKDGFACLWAQRLMPDTKHPDGAPIAVRHFHNIGQLLNDDGAKFAIARNIAVVPLRERRSTIWMARRSLP